MIVVREADLRFIETPGGNAGAPVATPSVGAIEVSVIRQRQQPGGTNPAHTHDREEVMVVLKGLVAVTTSEESVMLRVGDGLIIPPHTQHQVENRSESAAEWLLVAPHGVGFFHASGEKGDPPWAR